MACSGIKIQTSFVQQQQRDGCGWYAIAFETTLLYGKDPRKFFYEPRKFISYFKQCLTDKTFPRFRFCLIRKFQLHATKKLQLSQFAVAAGGPRLLKILAKVLGRLHAMSAGNGFTKMAKIFPLKQNN